MGALKSRLEMLKIQKAKFERKIKNLQKVKISNLNASDLSALIARSIASKADIQEQIDACENAMDWCERRFA